VDCRQRQPAVTRFATELMLRSIAKVAVTLNVDKAANNVVERFYSNKRRAGPRLLRRFQILGYHKVSPERHPFFAPVHPDVFEQHMRFLNRCYRVMSLQELVARSAQGDVPERAVAITFDDGYRDNYDYAFPILQKYRFPATIFVATGAIGTGKLIWHDRVFDAFRFATVERARLNDAAVPELILNTGEARTRSLEVTLARAKCLFGQERQAFIDDIDCKLRPDLLPGEEQRMLTWDQIRVMQNAGMEFGSHTVSHTILARLPKREMIQEVTASKEELSSRLGTPVLSFAYPNGKTADYNEEVKSVLRECGYSCAVTCRSGFNHAFSDVFELRRGLPWQKEIELFRFQFFLQRHGLA
jgi:peptidoglycan/xylan/chitin deacetylase (PgdA/CDA1 family)